LGIPNKYIALLLPMMVDDMLEITLDKLYPSQNKTKKC